MATQAAGQIDPFELWEGMSGGWERRRAEIDEICTPVRDWLLRELAPQPGQTILELAAGLGSTGFEAAKRVGPDGRVITSDFAPSMLAGAQRHGETLGVQNVEYRVIDGQRIELGDDSFDGVICRFGYMLMPDPAAALAETRRVLRSGGRVALAVWAALERNPYFATIAIGMVKAGHVPPPDPEAPGPFRLADPARVEALLAGAGFTDARLEEVPVDFALPDIDDYMASVAETAGPIGMALARLSDSDRAALKAEAQDAFERFATDDGYVVPGVTLCAVATS